MDDVNDVAGSSRECDCYAGLVAMLRDGDRVADIKSRQQMRLAADMLEFFFGQMQMHSPQMNGQHSYRFRGGWPMTHCIGPSAEDAVKAAIEEIKRSRSESASGDAETRQCADCFDWGKSFV